MLTMLRCTGFLGAPGPAWLHATVYYMILGQPVRPKTLIKPQLRRQPTALSSWGVATLCLSRALSLLKKSVWCTQYLLPANLPYRYPCFPLYLSPAHRTLSRPLCGWSAATCSARSASWSGWSGTGPAPCAGQTCGRRGCRRHRMGRRRCCRSCFDDEEVVFFAFSASGGALTQTTG